MWTFLWRERRPFREEGRGIEGGRGRKRWNEMGRRDGPIEKNDVMCSVRLRPRLLQLDELHGNGNHRNCPDREEERDGMMESKSRILAPNGVWIVT